MATLKSMKFAETPPLGLAVDINGQRYDLISFEPYTRKDGTETQLSMWMGECAVCCKQFVARAPYRSLPESRRCGDCKQPGKAVSR